MAGRKSLPKVRELHVAPYLTKTVLDREALAEVVDFYLGVTEFVFDVETKGPYRGDPERNEVFWLTLAGPGRVDVIPMQHPTGNITRIEVPQRKDGTGPLKNVPPIPHYGLPPKQLWPGEVFEALEPVFFSDRRKIGHNVKFDLRSIAKYYGALPPPPYGDTMLSTFLVNENYRGNRPYGLDHCVERAFGYHYSDKEIRKALEVEAFADAARYCHADGKWDWLLWHRSLRELEAEGLTGLHEFECEVLAAIIKVEYRGADIDEDSLFDLDTALQEDIKKTYERIQVAAGWDINLNANAQVAKLVYEVRDHPCTVLTPSGQQSTAAAALEPYRHRDPVVNDVLDWSDLHKLHATFVVGIRDRLVDGRVHATFDQRGARTGRFSSRDPNLQNIPVRSERGRLVRKLFRAPPGYRLIIADYSQIELRILAHYTSDPVLIRAYQEGLDLHMMTARAGYKVDNPTYDQRARAKNVNFSIVFGSGARTLVERYGIPTLTEAQRLIRAFYNLYANVAPWKEWVQSRIKKVARETGEVPFAETILGRKRRLPDLMLRPTNERAKGLLAGAERQAISTIIQGSAADINKLAIVAVDQLFEGRDLNIILTVHDELVAVVPEDEADEVVVQVREAMEGVMKLRVPLVVDAKVAEDWSEKG